MIYATKVEIFPKTSSRHLFMLYLQRRSQNTASKIRTHNTQSRNFRYICSQNQSSTIMALLTDIIDLLNRRKVESDSHRVQERLEPDCHLPLYLCVCQRHLGHWWRLYPCRSRGHQWGARETRHWFVAYRNRQHPTQDD